jgi:hypothetical protein
MTVLSIINHCNEFFLFDIQIINFELRFFDKEDSPSSCLIKKGI